MSRRFKGTCGTYLIGLDVQSAEDILDLYAYQRKWVGFFIALGLWKEDAKLVLDKRSVLVYYIHNTLVH